VGNWITLLQTRKYLVYQVGGKTPNQGTKVKGNKVKETVTVLQTQSAIIYFFLFLMPALKMGGGGGVSWWSIS